MWAIEKTLSNVMRFTSVGSIVRMRVLNAEIVYGFPSRSLSLGVTRARQFADNASHKGLRVAEQHQGVVEIVERIVDAGESGTHSTLDDHHRVGFVDVQNRHSVDRTGSVAARSGVGDVIGADDESYVGLRKVAVDVVHVHQPVVGNVSFGEQ